MLKKCIIALPARTAAREGAGPSSSPPQVALRSNHSCDDDDDDDDATISRRNTNRKRRIWWPAKVLLPSSLSPTASSVGPKRSQVWVVPYAIEQLATVAVVPPVKVVSNKHEMHDEECCCISLDFQSVKHYRNLTSNRKYRFNEDVDYDHILKEAFKESEADTRTPHYLSDHLRRKWISVHSKTTGSPPSGTGKVVVADDRKQCRSRKRGLKGLSYAASKNWTSGTKAEVIEIASSSDDDGDHEDMDVIHSSDGDMDGFVDDNAKDDDDNFVPPLDPPCNDATKVMAPFIELWDQHQVIEQQATSAVKALSKHSFCASSTTAGHVAKFFLYIHERQCCWEKRSQGEYIFSVNPVFQDYFFCNNYRELDRGTCYFRSQMLLQWEKQQKQSWLAPFQTTKSTGGSSFLSYDHTQWMETVLFASYVYRQVNKIETFEEFGGIPTMQEWPKFRKWARSCKLQPFFTGAHQTTFKDKYLEYVQSVRTANRVKAMAQDLVKAVSSHRQRRKSNEQKEKKTCRVQACFEILRHLPGCGNFFAWQILCDLMECKCLGFRCNENQWTKLGPGAVFAMKTIFPNTSSERYLHLAKKLTKLQSKVFDALGVQFPKFRGKLLSLKDMEHALCEYQKFLKIEAMLREGNSNIIGCGARKWVSRVHMDLNNKCFHCHCKDNEASAFCDTCLNTYCPSCEPSIIESALGAPWICQRCSKFEAFFQCDEETTPLCYYV